MKQLSKACFDRINSFAGKITGYECVSGPDIDTRTGLPVYHAATLPTFIQIANYLKFQHENTHRFYFRGQTELYDTGNEQKTQEYNFQPSVFRGVSRKAAMEDPKKELDSRIVDVKKALDSRCLRWKEDNAAIEGLLQQYGVRTRWIDAVDNFWIALWFACHKTVHAANGGTRDFYHYVRRDEWPDDDPFGYVLVLGGKCTGKDEISSAGVKFKIQDLREKLDSFFTRPHAQHGLLIRRVDSESPNMSTLIHGIIRFKVSDAMRWIGNGMLMSISTIIPPPNFDSGFERLLLLESKLKNVKFPIYC